MKRIVIDSVKVSIAVAVAIAIANILHLEYAISAGIVWSDHDFCDVISFCGEGIYTGYVSV